MKRLIIVYSLFAAMSSFAQELDIHGSDVFVSQGETIGMYGGIKLDSSGLITNNGSVLLRSSDASFTNNSSADAVKGAGLFAFQSTSQQTIGGTFPSTFYNASIENSSSQGVGLSNNAVVSNQLTLSQGLLTTNANKVVVNNSSEKAVVFNDSHTNASYVVGTLERATDPSKQYIFPVGSSKLYNPVQFISSLHSAANVQAQFLPNWFTDNQESINLRFYGYLFNDFVKDGAWRVEPAAPITGEFDLNAAIFNVSTLDETTAGYALAVKNQNQWQLAGKRSFIEMEDAAIQGDYILSKKNTLFGVFAISFASMNNLRIVNVIETNRSKETRFIIPEVWKYENNQLEIYSQWGNQLLAVDNYSNDFDFQSYPVGTYYYTFVFTRNGKREIFKSFVEIVR